MNTQGAHDGARRSATPPAAGQQHGTAQRGTAQHSAARLSVSGMRYTEKPAGPTSPTVRLQPSTDTKPFGRMYFIQEGSSSWVREEGRVQGVVWARAGLWSPVPGWLTAALAPPAEHAVSHHAPSRPHARAAARHPAAFSHLRPRCAAHLNQAWRPTNQPWPAGEPKLTWNSTRRLFSVSVTLTMRAVVCTWPDTVCPPISSPTRALRCGAGAGARRGGSLQRQRWRRAAAEEGGRQARRFRAAHGLAPRAAPSGAALPSGQSRRRPPALKVDGGAGLQGAQVGAAQRLGHDVKAQHGAALLRHRQARAVDGHRGAWGAAGGRQGAGQGEPGAESALGRAPKGQRQNAVAQPQPASTPAALPRLTDGHIFGPLRRQLDVEAGKVSLALHGAHRRLALHDA